MQNWRWEADIPGLPTNYCEEFQLPLPDFDLISLMRNAKRYHYAGEQRLNSASASIYEDRKGTALAWFNDWRYKIKDDNGIYFVAGEGYKKDITLRMYDDEGGIIKQARLEGCFPTRMSGYDFKSAASDRIIATVEFSVDTFVLL
jgi:hypothetical protein